MGSAIRSQFEQVAQFFYPVLGTFEHNGLKVAPGEPLTWGCNNGILVIYDDGGMPWITRRSKVQEHPMVRQLLRSLRAGTYVPHSNDGGEYLTALEEGFASALEAGRKAAAGESPVRWQSNTLVAYSNDAGELFVHHVSSGATLRIGDDNGAIVATAAGHQMTPWSVCGLPAIRVTSR